MFLVRNMSDAEFGSMFFKVSDILSRQKKKMKYSDWMELRDIAIGNSVCECRRKRKVHNMDELLSEKDKHDIQVRIVGDTIYVTCAKCMGYLKTISHIDTAREIHKFFTDMEETKSKIDELVDKQKKEEYNNNIIKNNEKEEEKETMMNTNKMFKGLDFGKADKDLYRLSHLGLAIKNVAGTFVSYDKANGELVDVDLFDFDLDGMIYKMPVAHNQVVIGDVIVHNGHSMIVESIMDNGRVKVIDPILGEAKDIMPTKNMFGFNFFTKILCLMDMNNLGASNDNPFGNMMPMLMMSAMSDGKGNNNDMMTMMMMSQMMGGNSQIGDMFSNPMMMMAMMSGDGKMGDMLPMMMMMQGGMFGQQQASQTKESHGCGGNCSCGHAKANVPLAGMTNDFDL